MIEKQQIFPQKPKNLTNNIKQF